MQQARVEAMSNEMISVPPYIGLEPLRGLYYPAKCRRCGWVGSSSELTEDDAQCTRQVGDHLCLGDCDELDGHDLLGIIQAMAKPQDEPVAWRVTGREGLTVTPEYPRWAVGERGLTITPLYTRPVEQPEPVSSTSDKYKAELYDEVWQLARDMGFGNVTDALMKLKKLKKQPTPVAVVVSFDFEHPLSKERRTVTLTKRDVFDGMEDYFYDKLGAQICQCESVGETNVIDCNCDEYVHDFEIMQACLDEVARLNPPQQ